MEGTHFKQNRIHRTTAVPISLPASNGRVICGRSFVAVDLRGNFLCTRCLAVFGSVRAAFRRFSRVHIGRSTYGGSHLYALGVLRLFLQLTDNGVSDSVRMFIRATLQSYL